MHTWSVCVYLFRGAYILTFFASILTPSMCHCNFVCIDEHRYDDKLICKLDSACKSLLNLFK